MPPKVKFITPIWNPYVDCKNGKICVFFLMPDFDQMPKLTVQLYLCSDFHAAKHTKNNIYTFIIFLETPSNWSLSNVQTF